MFVKCKSRLIVFLCCCFKSFECGKLLQYTVLSIADMKHILDEHNQFRRSTKPTASDMLEMTWDFELAEYARQLSRTCIFQHSPQVKRKTSKFPLLGENLYITSNVSLSHRQVSEPAIKRWNSEMSNYDFNNQKCNAGTCGHYTQLVWAKSFAVGCGLTMCEDVFVNPTTFKKAFMFVCSYGPSGNVGNLKPYKVGPPCSACPNNLTCHQQLCQGETAIISSYSSKQSRVTASTSLLSSAVLFSMFKMLVLFKNMNSLLNF